MGWAGSHKIPHGEKWAEFDETDHQGCIFLKHKFDCVHPQLKTLIHSPCSKLLCMARSSMTAGLPDPNYALYTQQPRAACISPEQILHLSAMALAFSTAWNALPAYALLSGVCPQRLLPAPHPTIPCTDFSHLLQLLQNFTGSQSFMVLPLPPHQGHRQCPVLSVSLVSCTKQELRQCLLRGLTEGF